MKRSEIKFDDFKPEIFNLWGKQWMLLTSGEMEHDSFNTMTVGWGSIGIMWNKPFVQVVVRPTRYTREFMERYETFTLSAFSEDYKKELSYLGSVSGKDVNKIEKSGLKVEPSKLVKCPCFNEAELVIECKKIYSSRFTANEFIDQSIKNNYPKEDYHLVYFGQVLCISGIEKYSKKQ
ncbi:MAG: flavin reductase [Candidatus Delongbacteria bacterium]|nr:flavin reductase [Candidatus Delongbacteria bacterium]MCG2760739.1 flavin reductase [Candidatus Delongbacteria bacterium]